MLDGNLNVLRQIDMMFNGRMPTMFTNQHNLEKAVRFSDVLVTAAAKPGGRAPRMITRDQLKAMKPRAVVLDFAINSGGNLETSRPTTLANPSYVEEEIIHYCVPNVTSRVARTSSYAFSNAIQSYLLEIGEVGIEQALKQNADLRRGVNTLSGKLAHSGVAEALKTTVEVNL
jgi:alanine dehydrogenase